jgi:linoleoyl-CoA desaturase
MLGSANISGSKAMHVMTGNLSHQIEHHLIPDQPSNRYSEIAPKVQALFEKYDLSYCARPIVPQVYSAWHKVVRLSLPNHWLETTTLKNLPRQLKALKLMATGSPKQRRVVQLALTREAKQLREAA